MKWLHILYDAIWLRCHPITSDEHGRGLYPNWRASFDVARIIASVDEP